jgi:hypothetical protein
VVVRWCIRLDVCSSAAVGSIDMVTKRSVESRTVDTRNSSAFRRLALNGVMSRLIHICGSDYDNPMSKQ